MIIPEIIIYHNINSILELIKNDYNTANDKTKTIISRMFTIDDYGMELKYNRFNYKEQAIKLFVTNQRVNSSRRIEVSMGYNVQRSGLPTIHITLPDEQADSVGIGMGEGYQDSKINEDDNSVISNFTAVYRCNYNCIITSDNSSEAVLIYHTLKNLLFSVFPAFELRGLRDIKFSGQDLNFQNDMIPAEVFHRNLGISFFYETTVDSIQINEMAGKIIPDGYPISLNDEETEEEKEEQP